MVMEGLIVEAGAVAVETIAQGFAAGVVVGGEVGFDSGFCSGWRWGGLLDEAQGGGGEFWGAVLGEEGADFLRVHVVLRMGWMDSGSR